MPGLKYLLPIRRALLKNCPAPACWHPETPLIYMSPICSFAPSSIACQLMDNQQVHRLPRNPSDLKRLARTMGFSGNHEVDEFRESYEARVRKVRAIFERILP